jgi:hypothetical protein
MGITWWINVPVRITKEVLWIIAISLLERESRTTMEHSVSILLGRFLQSS